MTLITIPNRPVPSEARNINAILADFDAITAVVNGQLDASNMNPVYVDGSAGTPSLRTLGTAADQAAPGNISQQGYRFQVGVVNLTAIEGENLNNLNLAFPWPATHALFVVGLHGATSNIDLTMRASGVVSLEQGFVEYNSASAQNVQICWFSVGS